MKNNFNSLLSSIITGMGFGMPTTIICMIIIGGYKPIFNEFIVWTIASALFGLVSKLFFNNEKISMPIAILLHFLSCFTITIIAGYICGYANSILPLIMGIAPIFIIAYLIIYFISILTMKIEAKRVTGKLNNEQ